MAHPRRAESAQALVAQLHRFPVRVVFDPDPDAKPSTVRTAHEAWRPWDSQATHHMVLQDDAILHPAFEDQVLAAATAQPESILSFFSEWGSFTSHALRVAALAKYSWVVQSDVYLGTQAALMPVKAAAAFVDELGGTALDVPDDHAIHDFAHRSGLAHYVSNPNLVNHEVESSLIGNSFQGARRAAVFTPDAIAPISWWAREPLTNLIRIPSMQWSIPGAYTYAKPNEDGAMWRIRPRLDLWGSAASEVEGVINATFPMLLLPGAEEAAGEAAHAVVSVLADQVALASALPAPKSTSDETTSADPVSSVQDAKAVERVARRCSQEAVRTIAPGCLRRVEAKHPGSFDIRAGEKALLHMVGEVLPMYLDVIPFEDVRHQCLAGSVK